MKAGANQESRFAATVSGSGPGYRPHILPNFDDDNRTVVIGSPGGTVVLDCRISQLQDYTVTFTALFQLSGRTQRCSLYGRGFDSTQFRHLKLLIVEKSNEPELNTSIGEV